MSEEQDTKHEVAEAMEMLGKGYDQPEVPEGFNAPNHTQSPNDFFDYYLKRINTLAELKIVCAFIRFTFGYHREGFKMGIAELSEYTGLSRKSVTDGAAAAEKRKLLRRSNPGSRKRAEWELYVSRKVYASDAYNLRETRVNSRGQVGVKERKKERIKQTGDKLDTLLAFEEMGNSKDMQEVEDILVQLETGLRLNIARSLKNQQVAKWILRQSVKGETLEAWLAWLKSDEWRASHSYLYADLNKIKVEWPQAFAPTKTLEEKLREAGYHE